MVTAECRIPAAAGIHARVAVELARVAQMYESEAIITFAENRAPATDIMALMRLDVRQGEIVRLGANGPDADDAVEALLRVLENAG